MLPFNLDRFSAPYLRMHLTDDVARKPVCWNYCILKVSMKTIDPILWIIQSNGYTFWKEALLLNFSL